MALNFPSSPTIGQIYVDSTSGFSYEWDGTVWKSFSASSSSNIKKLDDISGSFNGITTSFSITSNSTAITPPSSQSLIVNLGGVIQDPSDDYSVSGSNLIFSTAPVNGLSFSGVSLGPAIPINTISVGIDTTTNDVFYPTFVQASSGNASSVNTANSKLTFNPSLGKLTATIVNSSSDKNLKKDISVIDNSLEKIKKLDGVNFTWKDSNEKSMGVIAQDLQRVFPELVSEDENGLSVNYNGLIAVLIEAIKDLEKLLHK